MRAFLWTFAAVFGGIYLFSKWTVKGAVPTASGNSYGVYAGPEIDPVTGAYTPSGYGLGTVDFVTNGLGPGNYPVYTGGKL